MMNEPIETNLILEQAKKVEDAKFLKIQELLCESTDLTISTENRQGDIKLELKALGYKIPRKKKEVIPEIAVDNTMQS